MGRGASMWCIYCRAPVTEADRICPECGRGLNDKFKVIRCGACGKYIVRGSGRCKYCNEPIDLDPKPARKKGIGRRVALVLFAVVALLAVALLAGSVVGSIRRNRDALRAMETAIESALPQSYVEQVRDAVSCKRDKDDNIVVTVRVDQRSGDVERALHVASECYERSKQEVAAAGAVMGEFYITVADGDTPVVVFSSKDGVIFSAHSEDGSAEEVVLP